MGGESPHNRVSKSLCDLVRHASQERVRIYSRRDDFTLHEMPDGYQVGNVLGNWMSLILMGGESVRITLKLHFAYRDVKAIAHPIYGADSSEQISDAQATDFVKELCNLIAGFLVQIFEQNDLSLGISLPLCTRGLYEVFADYTPTSEPLIRFSDLWVMESNDGIRLPGSVLFEVMDAKRLEKLLDFDPEQGAGEEEDDDNDEGFDFL